MRVAMARRERRLRKKALLSARKDLLHDQQVEILARRRVLAETKRIAAFSIQGLFRTRRDRRAMHIKMRRRRAAVLIQTMVRGRQGRAAARRLRAGLLRVVPTRYQMSKLRKECDVVTDSGEWQELRDRRTHAFLYYNKKTGDSQWDPPLEQDVKFQCNWEGCMQGFMSARGLELHKEVSHQWECEACQTKNNINAFPNCVRCDNAREGEHGAELEEAYLKSWKNPINVEAMEGPRNKKVIKNILTGMNPLFEFDREWMSDRLERLAAGFQPFHRCKKGARRQGVSHTMLVGMPDVSGLGAKAIEGDSFEISLRRARAGGQAAGRRGEEGHAHGGARRPRDGASVGGGGSASQASGAAEERLRGDIPRAHHERGGSARATQWVPVQRYFVQGCADGARADGVRHG